MANLYREQAQQSTYKDVRFEGSQEDWDALLNKSTTFYVGNLSFYTTEEQIYALFSKCGEIKRIIMGLDRVSKTPCGFCFVEYAPPPPNSMHAQDAFSRSRAQSTFAPRRVRCRTLSLVGIMHERTLRRVTSG